jgi:iron complex transport system substrate-binding protein
MKYLAIVVLLCLSFTSLAGCQTKLQPETYTDDMGRQVVINGVPKRIVSLAPSNTEILFALGLGDRVIGVTRYCNYPEEAKGKEIVGGFATPDLEKIIALEPDLILAFGTLQKLLVAQLEERGQTVFWIYPHTVNEVLDTFERFGKLTGSLAAAQDLRKRTEEKIKSVEAKIKDIPEQERVNVFRVMGIDPPGTIGGYSFQTDVYRHAGGRNIFTDTDKDYFELDFETLHKLDPEIIIICGEDEEESRARLKNHEGWQGLTAVKEGRIIVISCDLICRPSPRIGLTIEELARKFYPERFE